MKLKSHVQKVNRGIWNTGTERNQIVSVQRSTCCGQTKNKLATFEHVTVHQTFHSRSCLRQISGRPQFEQKWASDDSSYFIHQRPHKIVRGDKNLSCRRRYRPRHHEFHCCVRHYDGCHVVIAVRRCHRHYGCLRRQHCCRSHSGRHDHRGPQGLHVVVMVMIVVVFDTGRGRGRGGHCHRPFAAPFHMCPFRFRSISFQIVPFR